VPVSALLRASHPVPGVAVTLVAVVLAIAVGLEPGKVVLIGLVVGLDQLSVGWSNDWIDADRDRAAGRNDKPVAQGAVSREVVRGAAIAALLVSIVLGFLLGAGSGAVHTVFVLSAWAYNAGLKRTAVSVLPYLVAFGSLPLIVTLAADPPASAAWWAVVAGAGLGFTAHLANVLPDLDDDARTGVRGFPHRLGPRVSGVAAFGALATVGLLIAIAVPAVATAVCALLIIVIAGFGVRLVITAPPRRTLFVLVLAAALLIVAALAFSGAAIVAR